MSLWRNRGFVRRVLQLWVWPMFWVERSMIALSISFYDANPWAFAHYGGPIRESFWLFMPSCLHLVHLETEGLDHASTLADVTKWGVLWVVNDYNWMKFWPLSEDFDGAVGDNHQNSQLPPPYSSRGRSTDLKGSDAFLREIIMGWKSRLGHGLRCPSTIRAPRYLSLGPIHFVPHLNFSP
jgi:hypothetical protein